MKRSKSVKKRKTRESPSASPGRVTAEIGGSPNPKKPRISKQVKPVVCGINHGKSPSSHSDQIDDNLVNKGVSLPTQIGAEAPTSSAPLVVNNVGESPPNQEADSMVIRPSGISDGVNTKLPSRLFPISRLPDHARLNIYSKPQHLGTLFELLKGSTVWRTLMESQFRKLWELPVSRCYHSAKLIHGLLSRQLLTKKKHELWMVYGGYPIRFSLREFHTITGLECGPLPSESDVEAHQDPAYLSVWNRLFGSKAKITINDVLDMLRKDLVAVGQKRLSDTKKLSLALLVIIDGVVAVNNKDGLVNCDVVEMLHDTRFFMTYPWGRVSFNQFTQRFCPSTSGDIDDLRKMLKCQQSTCCYGFPLALQLQIFQSIPALCAKLKLGDDLGNFTERPSESLSSNIMLRESHVNKVEFLPNLSVKYTVFPSEEFSEVDMSWPDEEDDPKLDFLLSLISENHQFHPTEWPVAKAKEASKIPTAQNIPKPERKKRQTKVSAPHQSNELALIKDWITEQTAMLRENLRDDMRKLLQDKFPTSTCKAADISNIASQSKRKRKMITSKTPTPRRAREVESLSTGTSSSNNTPSLSNKSNKNDGNSGDHRWGDYGPALNITRHLNDQNPQDPDHPTNQNTNESQFAFDDDPPHPCLQVDDQNLREVDVRLSVNETLVEYGIMYMLHPHNSMHGRT